MEAVLYITAKVISLLFGAIALAMSARVIMQLIAMIGSYDIEGNKAYIFCFAVTEIFVTPFRYLCAKFNLFTSTPIDAPFFIAYLSIVLIRSFLPII